MVAEKIAIVKRKGKRPSEYFQNDKLYSSVRAACLSVRTPEGVAESTALSVCKAVRLWLESKQEVTSGDIRRKAAETLDTYHPEASYLYKHYRVIL